MWIVATISIRYSWNATIVDMRSKDYFVVCFIVHLKLTINLRYKLFRSGILILTFVNLTKIRVALYFQLIITCQIVFVCILTKIIMDFDLHTCFIPQLLHAIMKKKANSLIAFVSAIIAKVRLLCNVELYLYTYYLSHLNSNQPLNNRRWFGSS